MQYKTMVLEFIKEYHPDLHEKLRSNRKLLRTMNAYAAYLKGRQVTWMREIRLKRPQSELSQISSEALELALEDMEASLRQDFSTGEREPLSLDAAIAFTTHHTPTA